MTQMRIGNVQRVVQRLPVGLRRIRVVQWLGRAACRRLQRVKFQSGELVGDLRDIGIAHTIAGGQFADYGYFDLAHDLLRVGEHHSDVGANFGFHTFGIVHFAAARGVSFSMVEANPECVRCLKASRKLSTGSDVTVIHAAAVEDSREQAVLHTSIAASGTGMVARPETNSGVGEGIQIPARTLDDIYSSLGVDRIGLMKMDIEGSEPDAMQGMIRLLSKGCVRFLYFEINPDALRARQREADEAFDILEANGYRLCWPHTDGSWIASTYGIGEDRLRFDMMTLAGAQPRKVAVFDRTLYRRETFGQCDLLAVAPEAAGPVVGF